MACRGHAQSAQAGKGGEGAAELHGEICCAVIEPGWGEYVGGTGGSSSLSIYRFGAF